MDAKRMCSWTVGLGLLLLPGCAGDCPTPTVDLRVCDPGAGPFTLEIDNPYFPLPVGLQVVMEGKQGNTQLRIVNTVLDETELVAGVVTRVLEEAEFEDGEVVEISRNFYAQAPDGTVCYFGESVDDYKKGKITGHGGEWRAGEGKNVPGIIMPGEPRVGQVYFQEFAPGSARDMAEVIEVGATVETPAGTFTDAVVMVDCDPLSGGTSDKVYVRGIGMVVDSNARLVSYE